MSNLIGNKAAAEQSIYKDLVAFVSRLDSPTLDWWRRITAGVLLEWEKDLAAAAEASADDALAKDLRILTRELADQISELPSTTRWDTMLGDGRFHHPRERQAMKVTALAITRTLGLMEQAPRRAASTLLDAAVPASDAAVSMERDRVFISHASKDARLVQEFKDLLELGVGVTNIFCTSDDDNGLNAGDYFVAAIQAELKKAACVLVLVSPNFHSSAFCMCELGAVWMGLDIGARDEGTKPALVPILFPSIGFTNLPGILHGSHCLVLDTKLDTLRDRLIEQLGIRGKGTATWNRHRDAFLQRLPELLAACEANTATVSRDAYDRLKGELALSEKRCADADDRLAKQRALISDLQTATRADEVAGITASHSSASARFEGLTDAARTLLSPMPVVAARALYYETRGEPYRPDEGDADAIQAALEHGFLAKANDEWYGAEASASHRKVVRARAAVVELVQWLDEVAGSEEAEAFYHWYESEYDEEPDPTLRPFWQTHLVSNL